MEQCSPHIHIQHLKLLGVTLDTMFNFRQHAVTIKNKLHNRNNILKALAGTSWGKDKEILTTTYKAISQSVMNYGCPIWTPTLSYTNTALRTNTGNVKMAPISHLLNKTKIYQRALSFAQQTIPTSHPETRTPK